MITVEWYKTPDRKNFYDGIVFVNGVKTTRVVALCGGWEIPKGERRTKSTARFVEWLMAGNADPIDYPVILIDYLFDIWKETNPTLYTEQRRKLVQYGVDMIEREERKLLDYQTNPRYDGYDQHTMSALIEYAQDDIKRWKSDLNELVNRHSENSL